MPAGQRDPELKHFSLAPQQDSVLPTVKAALAINPQLKVMASPWSAPGWMKTSDSLVKGRLKPEAYEAFARYLSRYVGEMGRAGVPVTALTLQNEPHFEPGDYPGMRVEPAQRAAFIGGYLGPRLAAEHPGTALFDWDHNWDEPESPAIVLSDPKAARYIAGVAWHCYGGDVRAQGRLHERFPDKETWFTECSGGGWAPDWSKNLMYFTRTLVIDTTRNWARGQGRSAPGRRRAGHRVARGARQGLGVAGQAGAGAPGHRRAGLPALARGALAAVRQQPHDRRLHPADVRHLLHRHAADYRRRTARRRPAHDGGLRHRPRGRARSRRSTASASCSNGAATA
jgi:hypothetical protein